MPTSKPQVAFMAAALVLLVMPLLVMFGLTALGIATQAGIASRVNGVLNGWAVLTLFVIWVLLVVAAVLALVSRLTRRTTRS